MGKPQRSTLCNCCIRWRTTDTSSWFLPPGQNQQHGKGRNPGKKQNWCLLGSNRWHQHHKTRQKAKIAISALQTGFCGYQCELYQTVPPSQIRDPGVDNHATHCSTQRQPWIIIWKRAECQRKLRQGSANRHQDSADYRGWNRSRTDNCWTATKKSSSD